MKLRRLWLGEFRNLRDVAIIFDEPGPLYGATSIRFFVGLNGTGKSNALEGLGLIFSHLAASAEPGFPFDLEYELNDQIIRITTHIDDLARDLGIARENLTPRVNTRIRAIVLIRPSAQ